MDNIPCEDMKESSSDKKVVIPMMMDLGKQEINPAITAIGLVWLNSVTLNSLVDNYVNVMDDNNFAITVKVNVHNSHMSLQVRKLVVDHVCLAKRWDITLEKIIKTVKVMTPVEIHMILYLLTSQFKTN